MKLIKKYNITYIKLQKLGGGKVYLCYCGQGFVVPVDKKEVKCLYCGKIKRR